VTVPTQRERLLSADTSANDRPNRPVDMTVLPCEQNLGTIEIVVTDELEQPCFGVAIELLWNGKRLITATDRTGYARIDGLDPEDHALGFVALDGKAWELLTTESLGRQPRCPRATWCPGREEPEAAATHVVRSGDCITSIAHAHGFLARTIWEAEENRDLVRLRKCGATLAVGDIVYIPARTIRRLTVQPGQRLRIRRLGVPEMFRPRFLDARGQPRAGLAFIAHVRDANDTPLADVSGVTNDTGHAVVRIPPDATFVEIDFLDDLFDGPHIFALGTLPPVDTAAGMISRLNGLGYDCGEVGSVVTERAAESLRRFRIHAGLAPEGGFDQLAQDALAQAFEP